MPPVLFERAVHRAADDGPSTAALPQAAHSPGKGADGSCVDERGGCGDVLGLPGALAACGRFGCVSHLRAAA